MKDVRGSFSLLCFALLSCARTFISSYLQFKYKENNKSPKEETKLGWRAGGENIPVFMFILAVGVNMASFNSQLCHSTLCLLLLMSVKLHRLPWNHHCSEQIGTGWCSGAERTAAISFQLLETGTAEWSAFSDLNKVIITLMLTVKDPALLSLWRCLVKSTGSVHVSPTCICTLGCTSHLHTFFVI